MIIPDHAQSRQLDTTLDKRYKETENDYLHIKSADSADSVNNENHSQNDASDGPVIQHTKSPLACLADSSNEIETTIEYDPTEGPSPAHRTKKPTKALITDLE